MISKTSLPKLAFVLFCCLGLVGCGGGDGSARPGVSEVRDGESLFRRHENSPVTFEEYAVTDSSGLLESWSVSSPFDKKFFADYALTFEDENTDGDMDSIALKIVGADSQDVYVHARDTDLDGYPDTLSYGVIRGQEVRTSVDLNLDGIIDFRDSSKGVMEILVKGDWVQVGDVSNLYENGIPSAVSVDSKVPYVFRVGAWEASS